MDNLPKSTILLSGYKIICEPGTHIIKDIVWDGIKCPFKDPNCIADHDGGDNYCISATTGLAETVIPEAPEGVGAAVIPGPTLTIHETPKTAIETNDTITLPERHGFQVGDDLTITTEGGSQNVTVTSILGTTQIKYKVMTPGKYMKRWTDSWLEGIDYKTSRKTKTGRRLYRRILSGDAKQRKLPIVRGCGHSLDLTKQPVHRNCKACWTAFFRNQPEMSENIAKILVENPMVIEGTRERHPAEFVFGKKFLQRFHEYCKLVEHIESLQRAFAEENKQLEAINRELAIDGAEGSIQPFGNDAEVSIEVG